MINELSVRKDAMPIIEELDTSNIKLVDLTDFGYDQDNYGVHITINGKSGYIAYGYGDKEYIGFAFDSELLTRTEKSTLNRIFKKFGKENFGEEDLWICWNYIGNTSLLSEYVNFVRFVERNLKIDKKVVIKIE